MSTTCVSHSTSRSHDIFHVYTRMERHIGHLEETKILHLSLLVLVECEKVASSLEFLHSEIRANVQF
jgi:hypothetical protein